jgi:hypothetical protein
MNVVITLILASGTIVSKCDTERTTEWQKYLPEFSREPQFNIGNTTETSLFHDGIRILKIAPAINFDRLLGNSRPNDETIINMMKEAANADPTVTNLKEFVDKFIGNRQIGILTKKNLEEIAKQIFRNRKKFESQLEVLNIISEVTQKQENNQFSVECIVPDKFIIYLRCPMDYWGEPHIKMFFALFEVKMQFYYDIFFQVFWLNWHGLFIQKLSIKNLSLINDKIMVVYKPHEDVQLAPNPDPTTISNLQKILNILYSVEYDIYENLTNPLSDAKDHSDEEWKGSIKRKFEKIDIFEGQYPGKKLQSKALYNLLIETKLTKNDQKEKMQKICLELWVIKELAGEEFSVEEEYDKSKNKKIEEGIEVGACGYIKADLLI